MNRSKLSVLRAESHAAKASWSYSQNAAVTFHLFLLESWRLRILELACKAFTWKARRLQRSQKTDFRNCQTL